MGAVLASPITDGDGAPEDFLSDVEGELIHLSLAVRNLTESPSEGSRETSQQHAISSVNSSLTCLTPDLSRTSMALERMQQEDAAPSAPLADEHINGGVTSACGVGVKRLRDGDGSDGRRASKKCCVRPGTPAPWKSK